MKISCLPVSLFSDLIQGTMRLDEWSNNAFRIGLDGIDISIAMIKNHNPSYLADLGRRITSLPIIMATSYPDFTHPDPLQRQRELDYCRADIALCSQLGVRYLRVLAGQAHPAVSRSEGIARAVEIAEQTGEVFHPGALRFYRELGWIE